MLQRTNNSEFSYILFKIGRIGPEEIYHDNLPKEIAENFTSTISVELGLYLSLIISQGKGMAKEGLFGPLPWYQLPNHELLLFSFLVKNSIIDDKRKKENTLCFSVIIFPKNLDVLMHSRYMIEKTLEEALIKPQKDRFELNEKNIEFIVNTSKEIIAGSYESGKKILQEQTLDEVISFESMELFAIYSLQNKTLKTCLIGKKETLPSNDIFKRILTDQYQISVREHEDGSSSLIIEFKELDAIIYVKLTHVLRSKRLVNLLSKIDSSLEILSTYIS